MDLVFIYWCDLKFFWMISYEFFVVKWFYKFCWGFVWEWNILGFFVYVFGVGCYVGVGVGYG